MHTCRQCGREYFNKGNRSSFCSRACSADSKRTERPKCLRCGQPVTLGRNVYCSKACSNGARWDAGVYGERFAGTSAEWQRANYDRNRDSIIERRRREYAEHPEKQAARNLARKHTPVRPCEVDGCGKPGDRHHDDYGRPLDVRYLCRSHHISWHKSAGVPLT